MGRDVVSLSRHNLDVSSIGALANDISNRIQFNVEYGYWAYEDYSKMLNIQYQDNFIVLGTAIFNPNRDTIYRLVDEKYQDRKLLEMYGDELFSMKDYIFSSELKLTQEQIEKRKKEILQFNVDLTSSITGNIFCTIGQDFLSNDFDYFSRWWDFCRVIVQEDYLDNSIHFTKYRNKMMFYCKLFGGDKIYYIDDQSDYLKGIGQGDEFDYTWEELEKIIFERVNNDVVSISEVMLNPILKQTLGLNREFPLAFFDDFEDLKV